MVLGGSNVVPGAVLGDRRQAQRPRCSPWARRRWAARSTCSCSTGRWTRSARTGSARTTALAPEAGPRARRVAARPRARRPALERDCFGRPRRSARCGIHACALSMDLFGITKDDLDPLVDDVEGVARLHGRGRRPRRLHLTRKELIEMSDDARSPRSIDARGMPCPGPLMSLIGAIREGPVGDVIEVLSSDEGSATDIPAWVAKAGHELVEVVARGRAPRGSWSGRSGERDACRDRRAGRRGRRDAGREPAGEGTRAGRPRHRGRPDRDARLPAGVPVRGARPGERPVAGPRRADAAPQRRRARGRGGDERRSRRRDRGAGARRLAPVRPPGGRDRRAPGQRRDPRPDRGLVRLLLARRARSGSARRCGRSAAAGSRSASPASRTSARRRRWSSCSCSTSTCASGGSATGARSPCCRR